VFDTQGLNMSEIERAKPDVLRVTEYILEMAEKNEPFGLYKADSELDGLNNYQIAKIMRDICLDPQEPGSLNRYTTIDNQNMSNEPQLWQLNANAYFSYLSYLAIQEAKTTNTLTKRAFYTSVAATVIAFCALVVTLISTYKTIGH
jgi:hypothetical protein